MPPLFSPRFAFGLTSGFAHGFAHGFAPRFVAEPAHRPVGRRPSDAGLVVRWLGTAGHVVETATTTILLDPFLARPSLLRTAIAPLRPDPTLYDRWLPARVDAICLGHSHYDHLLDAPEIARRTGARIVGSRTTASFARASGVPEAQIVEVPAAGRTIAIGDVTVRFVPSLHGRFAAGRVPFEGEVTAPPRLPARVHHYLMGGAFGIHLTANGRTLYHNGSADLVDAELEGLDADVLLVGLAGRFATRDYLKRLVSLLRPRVLVPTHHDYFFAPLDEGVRLLPTIDLEGFFAEARGVAPEARIVTPGYDEELCVAGAERAGERADGGERAGGAERAGAGAGDGARAGDGDARDVVLSPWERP